jgi:glyoxylase-like metal-dependent hydrolase (beta-lactamase superfamily II)
MDNDDFRFKVGAFNCLVINDRDDWDCFALVVETGPQRVLIDTGCGYDAAPPGRLMERLRAAGLSADEIDVVVFSHADCDHIGGAVDGDGTLAFPRARYLLSREEWVFRETQPVRLRRADNRWQSA